MADVGTIRTALETRLATVALPAGGTLRAGDLLADTINPPCALVGPDDPFIDWDTTMARGADTFFFKVWLFASRGSERAAQLLIDELCAGSGASSIKAALETDWPETNVASFAEVLRVEDYGLLTVGDIEYLGCTFPVMVVS